MPPATIVDKSPPPPIFFVARSHFSLENKEHKSISSFYCRETFQTETKLGYGLIFSNDHSGNSEFESISLNHKAELLE